MQRTNEHPIPATYIGAVIWSDEIFMVDAKLDSTIHTSSLLPEEMSDQESTPIISCLVV